MTLPKQSYMKMVCMFGTIDDIRLCQNILCIDEKHYNDTNDKELIHAIIAGGVYLTSLALHESYNGLHHQRSDTKKL